MRLHLDRKSNSFLAPQTTLSAFLFWLRKEITLAAAMDTEVSRTAAMDRLTGRYALNFGFGRPVYVDRIPTTTRFTYATAKAGTVGPLKNRDLR